MDSVHVIHPYQGTSLISFGMRPDEVELVLGAPTHTKQKKTGVLRLYEKNCQIQFSSDDKVSEIIFSPPGTLLLNGHNLLEGTDQLNTLLKYDPQPMEGTGTLIFLGIGVAVSGFYNGDKPQESIGLFEKGLWDSRLSRLKPYRPNTE